MLLRAVCGIVLACTLAAGQSLHAARQRPAGAEQKLRLLFVGDSFTFRNGGVAKAVAAIIGANAGRDVTAVQYAIASHTWTKDVADAHNSSTALYTELGPGGNATWDFVIFQERSLNPAEGGRVGNESQAALLVLGELARGRGARVALTLTWGYFAGDPKYPGMNDYSAMQDLLLSGYLADAAALRGAGIPALINPVGLAWQLVRTRSLQNTTGLPAGAATFEQLYNPKDHRHPSTYGTALESATIAAALTGCRLGSAGVDPLQVGPAWLAFVNGIANEVVFDAPLPALPPFPWQGAADRDCVAAPI